MTGPGKNPSKWDKPKSSVPPPINRGEEENNQGYYPPSSENLDDLPAPSTAKSLAAKYANIAEGAATVGGGDKGVEPEELPEEGTTKVLLAKFREMQTVGGKAAQGGDDAPVKQVMSST